MLREAELAAARHEADVRRAGRDATAAAIAAVALGTAFLLANWAAVRGLSGSLSGWRAPLCSRQRRRWWKSRWRRCRSPGCATC